MKVFFSFFRLIRFQNLLIIAATQYLMRYAVLKTLLQNTFVDTGVGIIKVPGLALQLSNFQFLCLVLSTVFLTAAGYVINDYFDTKTDRVNRPSRVIVGRTISRRIAMALHIVLNVMGIAFGFYLAYSTGLFYLGFVFLIVGGLLWFYSTTYKRQFLIGNILVAFLTGLVPFMVVVFEMPSILNHFYETLVQYHATLSNLVIWVGGFSFFAFIMNLIREVIKDMEDFKGDMAFGRRSLPVVLGMNSTKWLVELVLFLTIVALLLIYFFYIPDRITLIYMVIAIIAPLLIVMFKLFRASEKKDYHLLNLLTKLIMVTGIGYTLVLRYLVISHLDLYWHVT